MRAVVDHRPGRFPLDEVPAPTPWRDLVWAASSDAA